MDSDQILNLAQAAAMLYAEPETVSKLARSGELPAAQIGRGWIFMRDDVLMFLKERIRRDTEQRRRKNEVSTPRAVLVDQPDPRSRRRIPPELPDLPRLRVSPN